MTDEVKSVVNDYWDSRASQYDSHAQHVVVSDTVAERWTSLLAALLPPVGPPAPPLVMDVGCGTGFMSLMAQRAGYRVIGVDQSERMLEVARSKSHEGEPAVTYVRGDADALPAADDSVDAVIERHVLWTMADPTATLREWRRPLRPGGVLLLIEGDWRRLEPDRARGVIGAAKDDPYAPIAEHLPLMGGRPAEEITPYVLAAGFSDVSVTELTEDAFWEAGDPERPNRRFAIRAIG
jgi:ubiquinone/menaquinone biosynthesis C-methylase UbiE